MAIKKHIPNIITCCNLLSGAAAVFMAAECYYKIAFFLILLGAFFDFFDGMSARLLHVSSGIGKELDSLADDITFGLAPAMMLVNFIFPALSWWALIGFVMAAFSAVRLAKFNLDERQTTSFIGIPTPANAIFWGSLICAMPSEHVTLSIGCILLVLSLLSSWIMVCECPFFSFKFHDLHWKNNEHQYVFLMGCVVLVLFSAITCNWFGLGAAAIIWYVLINLLFNAFKK